MIILPVYKPQLVHKAPPDEKLDKFLKEKSYIATQKVDGYWSSLLKDDTGIHFYSRTISKKTGTYCDNIDKVPHIRDWAHHYLPNGTCILGEVYVPGGTSKDVTKILGSLPERAASIQEEQGCLHFWMHDMLAYNGKDFVEEALPYSRRYSNLCEYIDIETPLIKEIHMAPCYDNYYCDLKKIADDIISKGGEGLVVVDENSTYKPGSRVLDMFKIKRHDTIDCVITRIIPPTMEYTGKDIEHWPCWVERSEIASDGNYTWLKCPQDDTDWYEQHLSNPHIFKPVTADYYWGRPNAIAVGVYDDGDSLVEIGQVSSGFTHEDRNSLRDNPDEWLGSTVELGVMSVDKDKKSIRHSVFIRTRPDKPPQDCTVDTIFD